MQTPTLGRRALRLVLPIVVFAGTTQVQSAPSDQNRLPDFDSRLAVSPPSNATTGADESDPGLAEATSALRARVEGVRIDRDPLTGAAAFIRSSDHFLTGKAGQGGAVTGDQLHRFAADDPHRIVKAFLDEHRQLLHHDATTLDSAVVVRDYTTAPNGLRTVVWQQRLDGRDVFGSRMQAHLTTQGQLVNLADRLLPASPASIAPAAPAALLTAARAIVAAAQTLGEDLRETEVAPEPGSTPQGPEFRQRFLAPGLLGARARQVWLPLGPETLRLGWEVLLTQRRTSAMYLMVIDAETGAPRLRRCLTSDLGPASYRVFTSDSPSPFSPGHTVPSSVQPPVIARSLATLAALDTVASPNGWINDGVVETLGNNVDAHTDLDADNLPDLPRPQATGTGRVFDFPLDLSQDPDAYRSASVVNLFYWCNWMHDKLYALGFTEAAGNFQTDNFGRGGLGNDAVQADAQDGSGTNNANFSTPPDGEPGRMQMYLMTEPTPQRDGGLDTEIVLHEYAHGLTNRLVGGGLGLSALQSRGMGEGWSDFYALSLLSDSTDDPNAVYPSSGYASYRFRPAFTENYYYGIRTYPYTTDLAKNPLTFKDLDPTQASLHPGIPRSDTTSASPTEVHRIGEVWGAVLWDARARLIATHGAAAGNELMLQLVTDGLRLTPAEPNFLQARDAILLADLVRTGGANRAELWQAFARRGMGANASSPDSTTTRGLIENFDTADTLVVEPAAPFRFSGSIGGSFTPANATYTLRNTGTIALPWSVSTDRGWLDLSATSGTLAPGASTSVLASVRAAQAAGGNHTGTVVFHNAATSCDQHLVVTLECMPPTFYATALDTDPGWARTGQWAFGPPLGNGGGPDPLKGATGANVFGINLAGNYSTTSDGSRSDLTAGPFDCSSHAGVQLSFARWLNCDSAPRVHATVEYSTDGANWLELWHNGTGAIAESSWHTERHELPADADGCPTVFIRWSHWIGLDQTAWAASGWNIDDIELHGSSLADLSLPASGIEGTAALTGTVTMPSPAPTERVIALITDQPDQLALPATVTVPSGQSGATFTFSIPDDSLLTGPRTVLVHGEAGEYRTRTASIQVLDNETTSLTLTVPSEIYERGAWLGTVSLGTAAAAPITVSLTSSDPGEASVPAAVTIPSGQTSVNFTLKGVEDYSIDGTAQVTITASVPGLPVASAAVLVKDITTVSFSIHLSNTLPLEGATGITGVIASSATFPTGQQFALRSSDPSLVVVPASVALAPDQISVEFPVTILDNTAYDCTRDVEIFATPADYAAVSTRLSVRDNETLAIAATGLTEGGTGTGTVTISPARSEPLTVALADSLPHLLVLPASVTIPAGAASAVFTFTAADNNLTDGARTTRLIATVGCATARCSIKINDDDLHHFQVQSLFIPPQLASRPFPAIAEAQTIDGNTVPFNGTATISAVADGVALPISPTIATFTAGHWTGAVNVGLPASGVRLVFNDGAGHTGQSPPFDLVFGKLDHFTISPISSPVATGNPTFLTITAKDAAENTVASFAGSVQLGCFGESRTTDTDSFESSTPTPLQTLWYDSRCQVIYTPAEIGAAGRIAVLALQIEQVPGQTMNNWTIRMKHTTKVDYYSGAVWESTGWTVVHRSNTNINGTGWAFFPLDTPFDYDGTSNLMVDFTISNTSYTTSGGCIASRTAAPGQGPHVIYAAADGTFGDPKHWAGSSSPTPYYSYWVPNLTLLMAAGVPVTPAQTGNFSQGTWAQAVAFGASTPETCLWAGIGGAIGLSYPFSIADAATLEVSPAGTWLSYGPIGGPFQPAAPTWTLRNTGTLPMSWTITYDNLWLSFSATAGTLAPGVSTTVQAEYANISGLLGAGLHSATLEFLNNSGNLGSTSRSANLLVLPTSGDTDGDGSPDLLEYAFGLDPNSPGNSYRPTATIRTNPADGLNYLTFEFQRRSESHNLQYTVETSNDLRAWAVANLETISVVQNRAAPGEAVLVRLLPSIAAGDSRRFVRLRVTVQ